MGIEWRKRSSTWIQLGPIKIPCWRIGNACSDLLNRMLTLRHGETTAQINRQLHIDRFQQRNSGVQSTRFSQNELLGPRCDVVSSGPSPRTLVCATTLSNGQVLRFSIL